MKQLDLIYNNYLERTKSKDHIEKLKDRLSEMLDQIDNGGVGEESYNECMYRWYSSDNELELDIWLNERLKKVEITLYNRKYDEDDCPEPHDIVGELSFFMNIGDIESDIQAIKSFSMTILKQYCLI